MRADGSFRSLTTGISTVDKSQWTDRYYMKQCLNFRNDQQDGLRRRGGAELVKDKLSYVDGQLNPQDLTDFEIGTDILVPFEIDGDHYWLYSKADPGINGMVMAVFDEDGTAIDVDLQPGTYLNSADGNDSVRTVTSGDTVFVVNTNMEVEEIDNSGPLYENHSMLTTRYSPKVYSTINIKWQYPDFSQAALSYEVGEDHPQQPIEDIDDVDVGVNTVAGQLAQAIRAKITADGQDANLEIDQEGATVVFRNVHPTPEFQRDFSKVTIEDGSGGAFLAINGTVEDIAELPRFSHPGALLEVRPDASSNRGKFYMRAQPVLEAEIPNPLPPQDILMTAGKITSSVQKISGFTTLYGNLGSIAPVAILPTYPTHDCYNLTFITDNPSPPGAKTLVQVGMSGPLGESLPADALQYLELWDTTQGDPIRLGQVLMYQTVADPNHVSGDAIHIWEGTIDGPIVLVDGRDYELFYSDVVGNFAAVPEVRWIEDSAPDQNTEINASTMPHVLYRKGSGTFQFGSMNQVTTQAVRSLERRHSGDDDSNPMPTFVGSRIKDVATFQNRLCVLERDKLSMSVTGQPNDWFRGTVVQLLATSPIGIQSTSAKASVLSHFVEHNNDLMIFGPKGQFRMSGDRALTPQTASLPQASSYPATTRAVPVSNGNDVFFATSYGDSAGISQFSLDPQIENLSVAKPMADNQVGLMPGVVDEIVATPNLGIVITKLNTKKDYLFPLEFEPQIDILKPVEPTWSSWWFNFGIRIVSVRSNENYLDIMAVGSQGTGDGKNLRLYRIDLLADRTARNIFLETTGAVHLDAMVAQDNVTTTVTLSPDYPEYDDGAILNPPRPLVIVQQLGCPNPGQQVGYTRNGQVFTLDEDMGGGRVRYGYEFDSTIELPKVDIRDEAGRIQTYSKLRITDMTASLEGHMDAKVLRSYGGTQYPEQEFRGDPNPDIYEPDRYTARIQVKQDAENFTTVISSNDHAPLNLHQLEWRGTYHKSGRRF